MKRRHSELVASLKQCGPTQPISDQVKTLNASALTPATSQALMQERPQRQPDEQPPSHTQATMDEHQGHTGTVNGLGTSSIPLDRTEELGAGLLAELCQNAPATMASARSWHIVNRPGCNQNTRVYAGHIGDIVCDGQNLATRIIQSG